VLEVELTSCSSDPFWNLEDFQILTGAGRGAGRAGIGRAGIGRAGIGRAGAGVTAGGGGAALVVAGEGKNRNNR
jgi:hypothetical protein